MMRITMGCLDFASYPEGSDVALSSGGRGNFE